MPSPENTRNTPTHCRSIKELPKIMTDPNMVKNFRVVVIIEVVRGPKWMTVQNIKFYKQTNTQRES